MKKITGLRRQLHRYPELSGEEAETAQRIQEFLEEHHEPHFVCNIGGHGLAAVYEFEEEGPRVMFRCELDALPIEEANTFPHCSTRRGVSHKCGHDGHMAIVAGLGLWLREHPFKRGKVILLFQPAEETGAGGKAVVQDPKFRDLAPDHIYALHNLPGEPLHSVIKVTGNFSATVQGVGIYLQGKQSHASEPEKGINPAVAMAEIVQELKALQVADVHHEQFGLLTPVHLSLGEKAYGISAGFGELHYTMRTWNDADMENLKQNVIQAVKRICSSHSLKFKLEWSDYFPASKNDPLCNRLLKRAAGDQGLELRERSLPFRFGEDFGWFSREYSTSLFGLGAGNIPALHHSDYDFPEELLQSGISIFSAILRELLE